MVWYANEDADKRTFLSIKPPLSYSKLSFFILRLARLLYSVLTGKSTYLREEDQAEFDIIIIQVIVELTMLR